MEQSDLNLLHMVPPDHLQTLLKSRRLPPSSKQQHSNTTAEPSLIPITEIAQHLFSPTAISEVVRGLDEKEQLILHELVACGGRANSRDLALYLTNSGLLGKGTETLANNNPVGKNLASSSAHPQEIPLYPIPHPHGPFELALRRLLLLGLLFWGKQTDFSGRSDYTNGIYDGIVIVPQAVMNVVGAHRGGDGNVSRRGVSLPAPSSLSPIQDTLAATEGMHTLQRVLYLYWSLVAAMREGLPLVSNGSLTRSALRQVLEHLGSHVSVEHIRVESEVPHLLFIRLLLMKLGLLREQQGSIRTLPADSFFSLPLLERTRCCYRLWLETSFWNELMYLPEVTVRPGPAPLEPAHEEVVQARQTLMEHVLHQQAGVWCEFAAFIPHTKLYAPYLLFPPRYGPRAQRYSIGSNPYGWDFRLRRGWLTHREGWHLVEGGFIRAVVSGPLHWLGLVDINNEDNPTAFRPTPAISLVTQHVGVGLVPTLPPHTQNVNINVGAGLVPALAQPPAGRLIVQPNFELVALAPVSEALLISLDRFAERTSLERIAQYRLTKASVTHAIQMGLHANTIQQTLQQASGGEIPQNVQYSLLEWERQARRIELWSAATLLEVDDPTLLDALIADEKTHPLLGRRLAPTLIEIPRHHLSALQEALWQRTHLPALTSASLYTNLLENITLPTCEPQWRLHNDGLLQPLYAVLDLYLVAELERVSELDAATGWRRITPAALQRAQSANLSLEGIVRFLEHYCENGVPASFLIRLKLWGGGYNEQPTIQVEPAPLLSLPDQVLQDLQADEELKALLGTEVPQQLRLVHVTPDNLERVKELLRERGFEVL